MRHVFFPVNPGGGIGEGRHVVGVQPVDEGVRAQGLPRPGTSEGLALRPRPGLALREVGLAPDVVDCFHGLFFDVRPILEHSDAVLAKVFDDDLYTLAPDTGLATRLLSFVVDYASVTRLLYSRTGGGSVAGVNGVEHVWLAGRPAGYEGVESYVYTGCDAVAVLTEVQAQLGVAL